jgi:hypothetical protein
MTNRNQIEQVVFQAIDRVNEMLLEENAVPKEAGTALLGEGAALDSMGFVNFIVALEDALTEATRLRVNVVEALNAPGNNGPKPQAVSDFVDFLLRLVQAKA